MALAQKLDSSSLETTVQQQPYLQTNTAGQAAAAELAMEEVDYESLPTERLSAHLCAGAAAGMMEHCAMYPVDCVKVGEQAREPRPLHHGIVCCVLVVRGRGSWSWLLFNVLIV